MHDFELLAAHSTGELEQMLAETGGKILAGGTDLILFMEAGRLQPQTVIDISRLGALRYICGDAHAIRIGALATHSDLVRSPLLREWAPLLPIAAATIGAVQVRNRGTVGGNIMTASPAADTGPALLALGASVTLRSLGGERRLPLGEFVLGPGKTALVPNEYLAEIDFATPPANARGVFYKVGRRKAQAISLAGVAVHLIAYGDCIEEACIALGSVAPTVMRARAAEDMLRGQPWQRDLVARAAESAAAAAQPITDIRASADYRRKLVQTWVRRALETLQGV